MNCKDAQEKGIYSTLDSLYKSAIHDNSKLAVFKTEKEKEAHINAYQKLLQDFGAYLSKNDFVWDKKTRCFNKSIWINLERSIIFYTISRLGLCLLKKKKNLKTAERVYQGLSIWSKCQREFFAV